MKVSKLKNASYHAPSPTLRRYDYLAEKIPIDAPPWRVVLTFNNAAIPFLSPRQIKLNLMIHPIIP